MRAVFPSTTRLTWQGQRANTSPMESTEILSNGSEKGPIASEAVPRALSNPPARRDLWKMEFARIYFVAGAGLVKIGVTTQIDTRFAQMRNACPVPLEYLGDCSGTQAQEREWHDRFRHLRRHGEWFKETPELIAAIKEAVDHFWRNERTSLCRREYDQG